MKAIKCHKSLSFASNSSFLRDRKSNFVFRIPNFPKLPGNTYLFDMGYPYYISVDSKNLSFTSDQGLFILDRTTA